MLDELKLDKSVPLEEECQKALDRLNQIICEFGEQGYYKIKVDGEQFAVIKYKDNKEVQYVLCFAKNISECIRYINITYRVYAGVRNL